MNSKCTKSIISAVIMLCLLIAGNQNTQAAEVCEADQTQQCACPDNTTGTQICMEAGTGWEDCDSPCA